MISFSFQVYSLDKSGTLLGFSCCEFAGRTLEDSMYAAAEEKAYYMRDFT